MKKFLAIAAAVVALAAPAFAATNPFMDVPQEHWAYDAVAQLAASGVVSGYPDGAFKGTQPVTRYEMASVVARALTKVDAEKVGRQELAALKKLVMEFKDELDKLGVKVDKIDKRTTLLEKNLGGWKLNGTFWFDARFAGGDTYKFNNGYQNQFNKERFRLFLNKQINENTSLYAQFRWGSEGAGNNAGGRGDIQNTIRISHLYVDTTLPYNIALRVGRFAVDFENDYGLYTDYDALFGDYRADGFRVSKNWGNFSATGAVVRNLTFTSNRWVGGNDAMFYALNLGYKTEKFFLAANGTWGTADNQYTEGAGKSSRNKKLQNYGIYAGYNFTPAIALKGAYYWQNNDSILNDNNGNDSPKAWKLVLDIKQEALKFTSLWVEYAQRDNTFIGYNQMYALGDAQDAYAGSSLYIKDADGYITGIKADSGSKSKIWFIKANQKWNAKWNTFLRFTNWDYGTANMGKDTEWGLGIGYQHNPALKFELAYDHVSYGDQGAKDGDSEHVIRFRTSVNF